MRPITTIFRLLVLACFVFVGCEDDSQPTDACTGKFDQEAFFTQVADALIVPAYDDLKGKTSQLLTTVNSFSTAPNVASLEEARTVCLQTYLSWQAAAQYEFGPAEAAFLRNTFNNFPVNAEAIDNNIEAATWDLENIESFDKGLPALEYLLFGTGEDAAAIVAYFEQTPTALNYLQAIAEQLDTKASMVAAAWSGYRADFIANTGTADGSSLSLLVNAINQNYEQSKRDRLGIPSGVLTLGFTNPDKVEAFYSGESLNLLKASLQASRALFTGKSGLGFDDYLDEINAQKGGENLSTVILAQFNAAITAVEAIKDTRLSAAVDNEGENVLAAYRELTTQVVNLKTDMPSVLCVAITYVDNPSDSD